MKLTKIIIIFIICIMMIQVKSKDFHTGYHYLGYQPEEREDGLYRSYLATQSQYDPRKEGMITRIKDQGNTECCWAFATIAMAESNLIKQKLADKDIDLSEHHLSYFLYNSSNDPLNNTFQDKTVLKSYLNYLNAGGNYLFSFQFLSRYSGMVNENIVSSIPSSYENIQAIDHIFQYNHNSYTLKNTYYSLYNIENIKKMIDQYGAVGISYQYVNNPDTMNFEHNAIYNPDGDEALANHSVVIVGWDDYYDKNNFSTLPQNNGAWLIKNSWGEVGSEDGYFWMSYEEPSITDVVAAEFEKVKYDYNYHYDGNLNPSWATFENQMTFANIYQVKGNKTKNDELLKAVNIGIQSTDTKYSIQIYRNIKNNQDPTSGTLVNQEPIIGKTTYSGLYTIELDEPITLAHDDYYSIVVTLNKPNDFVKMFVESYQDSDWVELQLGTKENQSFYYEDNKWKDLHNESATARIKGLTVNAQTKSASHVSLSKTQTMIIGERKKLDVHLTSSTTDSKLLWQSSHPDIVEIDKNGYITALSLGQATITVTTEYGATASCLIEVSEKDIGIKESQNTINDINKKDLKTKRVGQHIVNTSDKSVIDLYIFLLYFGGLGMMICIYKRKYL